MTHSEALPVRTEYIAWAEFVELTSLHPSQLGELIELGWIEPKVMGVTQSEAYLFRVKDVYRARKMQRLCTDFELNSLGGTIIVDLLERIDSLETRLKELEQMVAE